MKNLNSFGNYPIIPNKLITLREDIFKSNKDFICYGNGRSYGDSALHSTILYMRPYDYFIDFDCTNNILEVQSGVLLKDILDFALPQGLFLKITPGTKLITVGGAICFDVHGKNHHVDGCFSECVREIKLLTPSGVKVVKKDDFLFKLTCGGAGLTGIILSAKIELIRITSKNINKISIKTTSLEELLEVFEHYKDKRYSVAWIDCFSDLNAIFDCGDFHDDNDFCTKDKKLLKIPINLPNFTLNSFSINAFNKLYFSRLRQKITHDIVDFNSFFYPLDCITDWNKIYGKGGFTQYQFILSDKSGLKEILKLIRNAKSGSFLAVLKKYGKANDNTLSFPLEGYSLALDFKITKHNLRLLDLLDEVVLKYGGRVYLAKDARLRQSSFNKMYEGADIFREYRMDNKLTSYINSAQSLRLQL